MERNGCKDWSTITERMRYVSWTRAHAAEYVTAIGQAVQAAGGRLPATWLEGVLHRLKHQGPERVLKHLAWLVAGSPSPGVQEQLTYLQKRAAHMQYPSYQQAGWPIGSGNVESANKLVVEARLKGAGMRLPSTERQSHAGAAQCGLQSALARDLGGSADPATSVAHESPASRQPTAADQCFLDPRLLGSVPVSVDSPACCCFHRTSGCYQPAASSFSSWRWLFLAPTVSEASSFHPCGAARGVCKKMKRTHGHKHSCTIFPGVLYSPGTRG
jgi:hypothetical protein